MYQNISRKYRPQTFGCMVGQDAIVTTLKNAIKLEKIAPAYLFCGCRGTGKTTLARLFAKALNCQGMQKDFEPCNQCPSCLDITQGKSLDVMEIDGASNRGIDDIRQINETVGYASASSKYKIYIIDEVHMLTKEAFNALLKTLEEPPSTVKFFFATTEPHKVLSTILSRCQRFDLHRLTTDQIVAKLQQISIDMGSSVEKPALELIAHVAEGGLRDAESLLDQLLCYASGPLTYEEAAQILGISPRSMFFKLDRAIESYNLSFAFELASELFSTGKDLSAFLDGLIEHYRTILLFKFNLPLATYLHEKERREYTLSNSFYTQEHCLYILDYLIHWMKEIHRTPFKRITLEMILLHLIRSQKRITLPTLVRRLEELESGTSTLRPLDKPAPAPKIEPKPVESLKKVELPLAPQPSVEAKFNEPIKVAEAPKIDAPTPQPSIEIKNEANAVEISKVIETLPVSNAPTAPKIEPTLDLPKPQNQQLDRSEKNRYDTLLRFAAVELEGSLKKEI